MKYIRNAKFYHANLDNEICLFDPENGNYHNLNKVGSTIWEILKKTSEIEEIISILMKKYDVTENQCLVETKDFIKIATEQNIILLSGEDS